MAASWQNQEIAGGQTKTFSSVVTWGYGSNRPILSAVGDDIPDQIGDDTIFFLLGMIADNATSNASFVVVFNEDVSTLYVIASDLQSLVPFNVSMRLMDAHIGPGLHRLDLYAVDETGEISDPVTLTVNCVAPTPHPSDTSASVSDSPFPSPTSTIVASDTPTWTPTPSPSPYVDVEMGVTSDVDSRTNFRLQGIRRANPQAPISISTRGFDCAWTVTNASGIVGEGIFSRLASVEGGGLQLSTIVNTSGSTAVVQFIVANPGSESRNVSIVMSTNVLLDEGRHALITTENNGTSFRLVNGLSHFQVFARRYPLVVDVDSYWFGAAASLAASRLTQVALDDSFDDDDAAFALSWRDRVIAPRTRHVLSALMSWGEVSNPPQVTTDTSLLPPDGSEIKWEQNISIGGTIAPSTAPVEEMVVYLVCDGAIVGEARPDANGGFAIAWSPSSLNLASGTHLFQIYAVDPAGSIASIAVFSASVVAPTAPLTATPPPTQSPSPSPTESASWGAVVDLPWYQDPGIDAAEEGVDSVTVGKIVIGVGIPVGMILVAGFGFLIYRYRGALKADMNQRLKASSASEPGEPAVAV
jgi:hypothetical protein